MDIDCPISKKSEKKVKLLKFDDFYKWSDNKGDLKLLIVKADKQLILYTL